MHITLLTIGSRGDLQPYVALGAGLRASGYRVRLATHRPYQAFVESRGLEFAPLAGNPAEILKSEDAHLWLESGSNPFTFIRQLVRLTKENVEEILKDCWNACQNTDLIIYSALGFPGYHIAERLRVPVMAALLQPVTRSRYLPPISLPPNLTGRRFAKWTGHLFLEQLLWQPYRRKINDWRNSCLELPAIGFWGPYRKLYEECTPFIYGFSPEVIPRPPDWPDCHHITGYWFLEPDEDWSPPVELTDFLSAGPPPVYVGFGSMTTRDPARISGLVLEALRETGERGLLLTGWGGLTGLDYGSDILVIDAAPHDWLFPKMRAVVHHGGAGTTAAGLRAGVPSVVVPFFGDQPYWGSRVFEMGVGPPPIPQKQLSAEGLAEAIQWVVSDPGVRERAHELGLKIRSEDGIGKAVGIIEGTLKGQRVAGMRTSPPVETAAKRTHDHG